jgi:hypothetical protein
MEDRSGRAARFALTCGVLGVLTAVWIYWMVLPGLVFGVAAVVLAWRALRGGAGREVASAALALGVAAVLLVPSVLFVADEAEDFGRDCGRDPSGENC